MSEFIREIKVEELLKANPKEKEKEFFTEIELDKETDYVDEDAITQQENMAVFTRISTGETNTSKTLGYIIILISILLFAYSICSLVHVGIALIKLDLYNVFLPSISLIISFLVAQLVFKEGKSLLKLNEQINIQEQLQHILNEHPDDVNFIQPTLSIIQDIHKQNKFSENFKEWLNTQAVTSPIQIVTLYANDFLSKKDEEAQSIIIKQVGLLMGADFINSNRLLDILLVLYFNLGMINDINKVYTGRFSLFSRLKMYKYILINIFIHVVIDNSLFEVFLPQFIANQAKVGALASNYILGMRLGYSALNFSRCIPLEKKDMMGKLELLLKATKKDKAKNSAGE